MAAAPRQRAAAPSLSDFGQGQLAQVQRARILSGAIQVVVERGAANVAIAEIVQRAGVSRRTFYELFADRDDCLEAAFQDVLAMATARVVPAVSDQRGWLAQLRAGVAALMGFLDNEPELGRLLICESLAGGPALSEWRGRVVAQMVAFVDEGRRQGQQGRSAPAMQADGSVGGVLAILAKLLSGAETVNCIELSGSLVAMIAMPYLGHAAAQRELERPVAPGPAPVSARPQLMESSALKDAGMRLTYRTLRVLSAIAAHPGASNREVGDLAEIGDQGQTSKLLRRLQRAELISNDGVAPGQGAPNVWQLTAAGRRLADSISVHSDAPGEEGSRTRTASRRRAASVAQKGKSHNSRRGK